MNISKFSNKEVKIREKVIKQLNDNMKLVKDIYKNYPKNITTIGIS